MNNEKEFRAFAELRIDEQPEAEAPKIVGYAAVFDSLSGDLGGFREKIERGAFTDSLANNDEVHALFNHSNDKLLGRRGAGTLRLHEDDHGLAIEIDPPNTSDGRDVVELLRRGDLVSMSFGFYNVTDSWETVEGEDVRTVKKARLFDVSVVTTPAYSATEVAVRSLEGWRVDQELKNTDFEAVGKTADLKLKLKMIEVEDQK